MVWSGLAGEELVRRGKVRCVALGQGAVWQAWQGNNSRKEKPMIYQHNATYKWTGYNFPVSATDAAEEIHAIEEEKGFVTTKDLVDAGRPEDALLHPCYEWNDFKAAEQYRMQQARAMLSSLTLVVASSDERPKVETKAFFNTSAKQKREAAYISVETVAKYSAYMQLVNDRIRKDIRDLNNRMRGLEEFAALTSAIDEFLNKGGAA